MTDRKTTECVPSCLTKSVGTVDEDIPREEELH